MKDWQTKVNSWRLIKKKLTIEMQMTFHSFQEFILHFTDHFLVIYFFNACPKNTRLHLRLSSMYIITFTCSTLFTFTCTSILHCIHLQLQAYCTVYIYRYKHIALFTFIDTSILHCTLTNWCSRTALSRLCTRTT